MKKVIFVNETENDLCKLIASVFRREFLKINIEFTIACYSETRVFLEIIQKSYRDKNLLFFVGLNGFGANIHVKDKNGKQEMLWSKIEKPFFFPASISLGVNSIDHTGHFLPVLGSLYSTSSTLAPCFLKSFSAIFFKSSV